MKPKESARPAGKQSAPEDQLTAPANHTEFTKSRRPTLNTSIGTRELCAWQPAAGITWVQSRSPQFARKLSQRQDGRLVVRGVAGGYLRTFEFRHPLAWAARLIDRYKRTEKPTNDAKRALRRLRLWTNR